MDEPSRQGSIIYVRYRDHVLFRNTDPALYKPVLRETVGWLEKESPEAVWILWERSAEPLPHEKSPAKESGLVLLKSDIVEMRLSPLQNFSNWLLCRTSALTSNRRVGASEREAKNSARKKSEGRKKTMETSQKDMGDLKMVNNKAGYNRAPPIWADSRQRIHAGEKRQRLHTEKNPSRYL